MLIRNGFGGLVSVYNSRYCAVKTDSGKYTYSERSVKWTLEQIEQIKRKCK